MSCVFTYKRHHIIFTQRSKAHLHRFSLQLLMFCREMRENSLSSALLSPSARTVCVSSPPGCLLFVPTKSRACALTPHSTCLYHRPYIYTYIIHFHTPPTPHSVLGRCCLSKRTSSACVTVEERTSQTISTACGCLCVCVRHHHGVSATRSPQWQTEGHLVCLCRRSPGLGCHRRRCLGFS
jgi:hypothetical protein